MSSPTIITHFRALTDDELLHLAADLESPLVRELASRLDAALGEVESSLNLSDETEEKIRTLLGLAKPKPGDVIVVDTSIEEMVDSLCDKTQELMSAVEEHMAAFPVPNPRIKCPGCLHTFIHKDTK